MRRISLIALSFILAVACAKKEAQRDTTPTETRSIAPAPAPQPNPGQVVTFGSGASGYLAMPATGTKHPGLIVIQEWWGVDDWVREQTDRFAREGYVALAVDLYRGRSTHDPSEAHELMRGLPSDRALSDIKAAIAFVGNQPEVDPTKIGVIGWCMGGGYSLQAALNEPRLAACVMNYGALVDDEHTLTKLNMPLLGNFGANDRGIPPADVKAFGAALTKYGKLADIKIYDGAGHGFMNPNNKDGYNSAAAQDAWARIDAFLARNLRDKIPNS